jgi:hypothetical protein
MWVVVWEKGHDFHALTDYQYKTQSASTYVTSDLRSEQFVQRKILYSIVTFTRNYTPGCSKLLALLIQFEIEV